MTLDVVSQWRDLARPSSERRFFAPEVVQTSAMDCGPATLKSLLEGFGISVSYGRLREACQTDVDGTSIDVMEEAAVQLGLEAEQIMIPADHLLLSEAQALPAIVVVEQANGLTHFVLAWSQHGPLVQVMDPATGRRWPTARRFLDELYIHRFPVSAAAWRDWAGTEGFYDPLHQRLIMLDLNETDVNRLVGANLSGTDLSEVILQESNLGGANLSGAKLVGADLANADLSGADLHGANLRGANLHRANLRGANLQGADLSLANLNSINMGQTVLIGANLQGATLVEANLIGSQLAGADLRQADLRWTIFHEVRFADIEENFSDVELLSLTVADVLELLDLTLPEFVELFWLDYLTLPEWLDLSDDELGQYAEENDLALADLSSIGSEERRQVSEAYMVNLSLGELLRRLGWSFDIFARALSLSLVQVDISGIETDELTLWPEWFVVGETDRHISK